jgi:hypothetical protein
MLIPSDIIFVMMGDSYCQIFSVEVGRIIGVTQISWVEAVKIYLMNDLP